MNTHGHPFVSALRAARHAAALLGLAALTAGCLSLKPAKSESRYYVLTATHPTPNHTNTPGPRWVVRLRSVQVADYLNTRDMAVREGTNEIHFALFHAWAEPLDSGIRRVLAENLRASPRIANVLTDEPSPPDRPMYVISVQVLACEGASANQTGSTTFKALWEISGPGGQGGVVAEQGVFRAPPTTWTPGDYGQLAHNLSLALDDFSKTLLSALGRLGGSSR